MSLTFLDFFAGVGGFRKGMEMAGHKCLGHCEIDKYANMSYAAIHEPKEDEWFGTDIRRTNVDELPRADVWCFGFPCQDISVAGKQVGFKGNRSSLFFAVTRLIRDTKEEDRPKYLFIENVKNLLSINGGFDFAKLLIELDEIGYDAEWQVLNSKNFGVPQNRERVFVIGHLRGRSGQEVFPIGGSNQEIGINVIGTTAPNPFRADGTLIRDKATRNWVYDPGGIMCTLSATDYKQPKQILISGMLDVKGQEHAKRVYDTAGISPSLNTMQGGNRQPKILVKENTKKGYAEVYEGDGIRLDHIGGTTGRGRVQPQRSNTLTTGNHAGVIDKGFRIRKLTPKECWRLQGWSDKDFEKAKKVLIETFYKGLDKADGQLYKQAGNGVTVNVIYEIAKRLA